jgi:hypothetical protein
MRLHADSLVDNHYLIIGLCHWFPSSLSSSDGSSVRPKTAPIPPLSLIAAGTYPSIAVKQHANLQKTLPRIL